MKNLVSVSVLAFVLAACGGGGSGGSTTPPVTPPVSNNQSPTITSATSVTIDEFQTGVIYKLTATDSDGQIASLAMTNTADAAVFDFDPTTGDLYLADPLTTAVDQNTDHEYNLSFSATDNDGAVTTSEMDVTVTDAGAAPATNFDLLDWKLDLPINANGGYSGQSINISETNVAAGYESRFFYTDFDGGMVMRSPSQGATTSSGAQYTRVELREMLRRGDTSISTRGPNGTPNLNNWVFSSAPQSAQDIAGAVDGTLCATLAVNEVTTTGENFEVGRLIIGQIHARDDEPIRLYYRKLPGNENGTIYAAHEISGGDDIYYNLIGSRDNDEPNPEDGFALNERFSYIIAANGNELDVEILQNGTLVAETIIDMSNSGYDVADDLMYFKAGVYHVNNDADPDEAAQVTFYQLDNNHPGYAFNSANCAATTP